MRMCLRRKESCKRFVVGAGIHTWYIKVRKYVFAERVRNKSLNRENKHGGLLPDCRFGMKESESGDNFIRMRWQHTPQLTS